MPIESRKSMSTLELPDFRLPVVAEITLARSASELYKKEDCVYWAQVPSASPHALKCHAFQDSHDRLSIFEELKEIDQQDEAISFKTHCSSQFEFAWARERTHGDDEGMAPRLHRAR